MDTGYWKQVIQIKSKTEKLVVIEIRRKLKNSKPTGIDKVREEILGATLSQEK